MARLPYLDPDDAEPQVAELLRKAPDLGIFRIVANAQRVFRPWMRFGGAVLDAQELDPLLREFVITRVAAMTPGAEYEWVQHVPILLAVGGTREQVEALESDDLQAEALGADGRLVVRFAEQVVREASPDEDTFAQMGERFSAAEIVQLLLVIGQYMMVGRVMATAQIDLDEALGADVLAGAERAQAERAQRLDA